MVASYAWAAPGGILQGTQDLARAFMGYPLALDEARRSRAAEEFQQQMQVDEANARVGQREYDRAKQAEQAARDVDNETFRRGQARLKQQLDLQKYADEQRMLTEDRERSAAAHAFEQKRARIAGIRAGNVQPMTPDPFEMQVEAERQAELGVRQAFMQAQTARVQQPQDAGTLAEAKRAVALLGEGFDPSTVPPPGMDEMVLDPYAGKRKTEAALQAYRRQRYAVTRGQYPPSVRALLDAQYGVADGQPMGAGQPAPAGPTAADLQSLGRLLDDME